MTKIAFFDTKPYDKEIFDQVNQSFGYDVKYFKNHLSSESVTMAKGYDVVCVFVNDLVSEEVVSILYEGGTRMIALRCSGFNNVDLKAAHQKIKITRVPAYSPNAIAEHTVALMLTLNRKIHRAYFRTRDANFSLQGLMGFDMYGKTAGVVGSGKIGKVLMQILRGFGMKVLAFDPYPDAQFARENKVKYVSLNELFGNSDIISLNCPLTPETQYIINERSISLMKPGVMLINTGRGKLIETRSLIEALKSGKISAAGLDVYEEESEYFFEDLSNRVLTDDVLARLLTFNNVIITSHQGFFTREALSNIAVTTLENIRDFVEKKALKNEISFAG
jgi:D-lactate dehydrogenase